MEKNTNSKITSTKSNFTARLSLVWVRLRTSDSTVKIRHRAFTGITCWEKKHRSRSRLPMRWRFAPKGSVEEGGQRGVFKFCMSCLRWGMKKVIILVIFKIFNLTSICRLLANQNGFDVVEIPHSRAHFHTATNITNHRLLICAVGYNVCSHREARISRSYGNTMHNAMYLARIIHVSKDIMFL